MDEMDNIEMPEIVKIDRIVDENDTVKTFFFRYRLDYEPGQFIMLWLPGMDEKPFSVSFFSEEEFAVTIERKGKYTEKLHKMRPGDKLGIRGPYGNPFTIVSGKVCVIGGGCGIAPILPLVEKLDNPSVIVGCQTEKKLLFRKKIKDFDVCTDDGSFGHGGFVTERLKELLRKQAFDIVYTCGPEPMMKAVFDLCRERGIECQASLERFMICGIGICSQCMCDNLRICKEGPVLDSGQLEQLKDFGMSAMIKTGKKVPLKEYYAYRTKYPK
jgi:dihydroorotate dehydrogenase electron transfer subunit